MISVTWEGHDESHWLLEGPLDSLGGVILGKPVGLKAVPERSTRARSTGIGVTIGGMSYGAMEGSLEVGIRSHGGMTKGEVHSAWVDAWSTSQQGALNVVDGKGYPWRVNAVLAGEMPDLDESPWARTTKMIEIAVPVFVPYGIWPGETITSTRDTDGTITVHNPGTVDAFPKIIWSGTGRTVTSPEGLTVELPATSQLRALSTDPGTGFTVTDLDGNVDTDTWAKFRGLPVWGKIPPGHTQVWSANNSAVSMALTPHCENPWR